MEIASWLLILLALAVGVSGSVASTWGLRRVLYRLQLDVSDLQNRLLIENKRKAAAERWAKPDKLALEAEALKTVGAGPVQKNPWDLF